MPIIPAADFVSQYYIPFTERVLTSIESEVYKVYPRVWIFSSNDVDSLCTTSILINQFFKHDEIQCMLNSVTHYNEISRILQEYKNYPEQREAVSVCVLVNLGAMVNILHSLRLWLGMEVEFWIFDFHRPVIDELFTSGDGIESNVLLLSTREYNFLMNNKESRKKIRKNETDSAEDQINDYHSSSFSSSNNPIASLSQTIDDLDILMGTSNGDSQHYNEQIEEVEELFGEYCGDPSSLVVLQTLDNSLTAERISGDLFWYSSIGISWCYYNRYIELLEFEMHFDLLNGMLSKYTADKSLRGSNRGRNDKKNWPRYLKNDLSLPLYRHWNFLDSVSHCDFLYSRMGLWKGESCREFIMNRRVAAGISLNTFTGKFYLLEKDSSKKAVQDFPVGFSGFGDNSESSLALQIPTFVKNLPLAVLDSELHTQISSFDMALILHSLLTNDCRFKDNSESFMDAIVSSGVLSRLEQKDCSNPEIYSGNMREIEKENSNPNQALWKEHRIQMLYRDSFRVGLQLLDLSGTDYYQIGESYDYSWRQLKRYVEEAKLLLSLKFKYVKMLLSSSFSGGTVIKHNYFTLAELKDLEVSHPLNLRMIGYSLVDVISRSQDLQDKLVIISKNGSCKVATVVGIAPGYDSNSPNFFGAIFSKVIDIILEENQNLSSEDHYFVQDEFDFSTLRIHVNFLDQFTSNLFKYVECNRHALLNSV
ncbi:CDC45-like protein [Cryptosporidium felis]|nr:CDC45-like protein [Cryptosporidium felis]